MLDSGWHSNAELHHVNTEKTKTRAGDVGGAILDKSLIVVVPIIHVVRVI